MSVSFESVGDPIKILEKGIEDIKGNHLKHAIYYENYPKVEIHKKEIAGIQEAISVLRFYKKINQIIK